MITSFNNDLNKTRACVYIQRWIGSLIPVFFQCIFMSKWR